MVSSQQEHQLWLARKPGAKKWSCELEQSCLAASKSPNMHVAIQEGAMGTTKALHRENEVMQGRNVHLSDSWLRAQHALVSSIHPFSIHPSAYIQSSYDACKFS